MSTETLLLAALIGVAIVLLLVVLGRLRPADGATLERALRDELRAARTEQSEQQRHFRDEMSKQLDTIRATVDEKLQATLEQRLGESFKQVSDRLEAVHRGLGEMQSLATGVGELKRVLGNVKTRGTWGEVQLGAILEQVLTPDQYARNVKTREGSNDLVEFAVKLPGPSGGAPVWLPLDAKFPQEDYLRLVESAEKGDAEATQLAQTALMRAVMVAGKDISSKYLDPPRTTDFAILFLPTEGLYAEVLRMPGLTDQLQRECRVVPAGPTTLAALLSSLRMGFRTLAIEERASEVWRLLGAVKTEFGRFGDVLERVKKQLETARTTLDQTDVRTRAMQKQLRDVEQLPTDATEQMLGLGPPEV
ncbi:MAG: DNA recombination protein RmuC [Gemmatimonadales bacterium]